MNNVKLYFEIARDLMGEPVPFKCEIMSFEYGKLTIDPELLEVALENFSCDLISRYREGIND